MAAFTHVILVLVVLGSALPLRADEFRDFRIPPHSTFNAGIGLSANLSDQFMSNSSAYQQRWHHRSSSASLTLPASGASESDQRSLSWSARADASGYRQTSSSTTDFGSYISDDTYRDVNESLYLSAGWHEYRWKSPIALVATGTAQFRWRQNWNESERTNNSNYDRMTGEIWEYDYSTSAEVGAGLGRVRDATGVFDVYVLEKRLRESGALTAPLSDTARQQLAALFYRRNDFSLLHERNSKYFWREVEQVLRNNGVETGTLGAWDWMRVNEALFAGTFQRWTGARIDLVIRGRHENHISRVSRETIDQYTTPDTTVTSRSNFYERELVYGDQLAPGIKADYYRPVNWRLQVFGSTAFYLPLNDAPKAFEFSAEVGTEYVIADRWSSIVQVRYDRAIEQVGFSQSWPNFNMSSRSSGPDWDVWATSLEAGLSYYVEDHVALDLAASLTQINDSGADYYNRDSQLWVGASYRFAGNPGVGFFHPHF